MDEPNIFNRIRAAAKIMHASNKHPRFLRLSDAQYNEVELFLSDYRSYSASWPPEKVYGLTLVRTSDVVELPE